MLLLRYTILFPFYPKFDIQYEKCTLVVKFVELRNVFRGLHRNYSVLRKLYLQYWTLVLSTTVNNSILSISLHYFIKNQETTMTAQKWISFVSTWFAWK